MTPFRNTSLDVRHSIDEVASSLLSLLDGNFPGVNSGQLYKVLPKLDPVCLMLDLLLQESLFKGQDLQC